MNKQFLHLILVFHIQFYAYLKFQLHILAIERRM
nr:MAG TPA: hypothetical protein [Caudoviricetes sp.]